MRQLIYLSSASDDLADILRYIAGETSNMAVAEAFVGKIIDRCEHLASLPGALGTARPELRSEIRSTPHKGYVIFFRCDDTCLEVVNVLNAHRDVVRYYRD